MKKEKNMCLKEGRHDKGYLKTIGEMKPKEPKRLNSEIYKKLLDKGLTPEEANDALDGPTFIEMIDIAKELGLNRMRVASNVWFKRKTGVDYKEEESGKGIKLCNIVDEARAEVERRNARYTMDDVVTNIATLERIIVALGKKMESMATLFKSILERMDVIDDNNVPVSLIDGKQKCDELFTTLFGKKDEHV